MRKEKQEKEGKKNLGHPFGGRGSHIWVLAFARRLMRLRQRVQRDGGAQVAWVKQR